MAVMHLRRRFCFIGIKLFLRLAGSRTGNGFMPPEWWSAAEPMLWAIPTRCCWPPDNLSTRCRWLYLPVPLSPGNVMSSSKSTWAFGIRLRKWVISSAPSTHLLQSSVTQESKLMVLKYHAVLRRWRSQMLWFFNTRIQLKSFTGSRFAKWFSAVTTRDFPASDSPSQPIKFATLKSIWKSNVNASTRGIGKPRYQWINRLRMWLVTVISSPFANN